MTFTWFLSLIVAFIIGFFARSWLFKNVNQESKLKNEINKLNMEYTSYRNQVSNHLQKTSQLLEGYKQHQSKLESHLFAATQNFANASLFDSVDSVESLPESTCDYLSSRGAKFERDDNSIESINLDYDNNGNQDDSNIQTQSHPRDYVAP